MSTHPALEGFAWQGSTLVVDNPDAILRIRRKNLSASVAQNVTKCLASFATDTMLPRIDDPFAPNELGTAAHDALETLYNQKPENRTREVVIDAVGKLAKKQWAESKLADRKAATKKANAQLREQWQKTVTDNALTIFGLENPSEVNVYKTELDIRDIKIGNGVPFRGFLDRTDYAPDCTDEGPLKLEIADYKFGKYKAPNPRFGDNYADQMRLYTAAVEVVHGIRPTRARLLYPIAGKERGINLSESAIETTLFWFEQSWKSMNHAADTGQFPATPSALCAWCPLANACPVANIKSDKAIAHAKTQPSKVALGIPELPARATPAPAPAAQLPVAPRIDVSETKEREMNAIPETAKLYPTSEYAAMNVFGLVDVATAHLDEKGQALSPASISAFSAVLAGVITRASNTLFGQAAWEHGKLTRIEFGVKSALRLRPAPFGGDVADWAKWQTGIEGLVVAKAGVALNLLAANEYPTDAYTYFVPAAVQAA